MTSLNSVLTIPAPAVMRAPLGALLQRCDSGSLQPTLGEHGEEPASAGAGAERVSGLQGGYFLKTPFCKYKHTPQINSEESSQVSRFNLNAPRRMTAQGLRSRREQPVCSSAGGALLHVLGVTFQRSSPALLLSASRDPGARKHGAQESTEGFARANQCCGFQVYF